MKAKFFAFDASGNQISNLSSSSFEVKENTQSRTVLSVTCPSLQPPAALSSVLTIDISGSMSGSGLNIAKAAANAWVNMLPLGKSECAVTSFDDQNYINQDFTTDRLKLQTAINKLSANGGTDYDYGFMKPLAGSLLISKTGKHKKTVVFITDGSPNQEPQVNLIISEANSQNCAVYSVVIGMNCPQSLKDISSQTGGQWFENIRTEDDAKKVYQQILMTAQGGDPCSIEWQSGVSCSAGITNVELLITNLGLKANLSYQSPNRSIAKLEFNPTTANLQKTMSNTSIKVTVTARNADFNIKNINYTGGFDIIPKNFPIHIKAGDSVVFTVSFVPADSGYVFCKFTFETDLCPVKYYASGGWPGHKAKINTLKLMTPNGGEKFVAGKYTEITWEGVLPDEKVLITYSINNGTKWDTIIKDATGLSYKWKIPKTPSNQCLARVTANAKYAVDDSLMVLIPAGTFQMGNTGAYSGYSEEKPVHSVTISRDFWMSKTEVTQKQYEDVTGLKPSKFKGDNLPVETVNWYEAVDFCNKLSEKEGLSPCYSGSGDAIVCDWNANGYRLPTEAEWEYACKAGSSTDFYNGSLTNSSCSPLDANLDKIGWYCGNENTKTRDVGQKEPNAFGLYDMSGNVWEWCWDWYVSTYYTNTAVTDPRGASTGTHRVLRGGSWLFDAFYCRSSARSGSFPYYRYSSYGFRISRTN
jgi:formylglycine-generating enzyme required for sulfatase activity/uncharacterized protein YegL